VVSDPRVSGPGVPAAGVPDPNAPPAGAPADPDDFLSFPRGPSAGDCVHAVFERADFRDRQTWDAAIDEALGRHPQRLKGVADREARPRLQRMLAAMLENVVAARLPGDVSLAALANTERLNELAFHLPAGGLSAAALNRLLKQSGYAAPRLGFGRLEGYLTGFIDLVFRQAGRWFLVDWKSNYLGDRADDYGAAQIEAAMAEAGYTLQYLLYTVALVRYLSHRLAGFDYERDFGGVLYVFARGVRPAWADRISGTARGVFHHRPDLRVVEALDRLIAGVAGGESRAA